jgi:23S rRNA (pseudouridine1915-N3)-methyltransferase
MKKLRVIWVGKTKDTALARLQSDYSSRIERFLATEIVELKDPHVDNVTRKRIEGEKILSVLDDSDRVIVLDPAGKTWSSQGFAAVLAKHLREDARRLTFVIGGFSGVSDSVRKRADILWSLSPLTFTHDICRVLLLEQVYRALTIVYKHPYSK